MPLFTRNKHTICLRLSSFRLLAPIYWDWRKNVD